jgi:hypothetical protein
VVSPRSSLEAVGKRIDNLLPGSNHKLPLSPGAATSSLMPLLNAQQQKKERFHNSNFSFYKNLRSHFKLTNLFKVYVPLSYKLVMNPDSKFQKSPQL